MRIAKAEIRPEPGKIYEVNFLQLIGSPQYL